VESFGLELVMFLIVTPLAFLTTGSTDMLGYLQRSVLEFDGQTRLRRAAASCGLHGGRDLA
jgi:hypothetical protein